MNVTGQMAEPAFAESRPEQEANGRGYEADHNQHFAKVRHPLEIVKKLKR